MPCVRFPAMSEDKIYDEPGTVSADDGVVPLDGPDTVDVHLTVDAAEEISDRLLNGALKARGQLFFAAKKKERA